MDPEQLISGVQAALADGQHIDDVLAYLKTQGAPDDVLAHLKEQFGGAGEQAPPPDMSEYARMPDGSMERAQDPGIMGSIMAGMGQGGTLGFGDELGLQDPATVKAAKREHPIITGISQVIGSLPYLAIPGAAASPVLSGIAGGAVQGAGEAEGGLQERAIGAGVGAAVGGVAGGVAKAAPAILETIAPFIPGSVKRSVIKAAGRILPEADPASTMARMGQLAPGSETMAAVDGAYAELAGVAARSPEAGRKAVAALAGKQEAIARGRTALSGLYEAVDKTKIPVTPEVQAILTKNGVMHTGQDVEVGVLRKMRDSYKTRMMDPISGKQTSRAMRDAAKANDEITEILKQHAPDVANIDADWAFMSERLRHVDEAINSVRNAASSLARQEASGASVASPRGSLSMGPQGVMGRMTERLMGSPEAQGQAVGAAMTNGMVPTPGGTTLPDFLRQNAGVFPWATNPLAQYLSAQVPGQGAQ